MIWETNSSVVVMLANCFENGVSKVSQYWPNELQESVQFGEWKVTLTDREILKEITTRRIDLRNGQGQMRTIVQLHYTAWPGKITLGIEQQFKYFERIILFF